MVKKLSLIELTAGRNVMRQCMGVKLGEKVLIVTDPKRKREAEIFFQTAKDFTDRVELISFSEMTENAQEPPKNIAQKIFKADVALLVTTYSLSHTLARKNACKNGCRIASMPGITVEMINRTLGADYSQVAQVSEKLAKILTVGKTAKLTSSAGTNISFVLSGRKGMADTGIYKKSGGFGNLPAGEAMIGPIEDKTNGLIVFDGAIAKIELDQPIKIIVKDGVAVEITGGRATRELIKSIEQVGLKGRCIGELGIGTNPFAKLCANVLEAEKVYATCHIALGNNISYGGVINVAFHSDGIITNPTLIIDDKIIVNDNKIIV